MEYPNIDALSKADTISVHPPITNTMILVNIRELGTKIDHYSGRVVKQYIRKVHQRSFNILIEKGKN